MLITNGAAAALAAAAPAIQIFPFLTAWHLQTAASFKLFSFAGSAAAVGTAEAAAEQRETAEKFVLHCQRSATAEVSIRC